MGEAKTIQVIIPPKRISFLMDGKETPGANFDCYIYCYKMYLAQDLPLPIILTYYNKYDDKETEMIKQEDDVDDVDDEEEDVDDVNDENDEDVNDDDVVDDDKDKKETKRFWGWL